LVGFGLLALATALYFRTPMSVHPMKVIGTMAVTLSLAKTPSGPQMVDLSALSGHNLGS
jgi:hypothetical protein